MDIRKIIGIGAGVLALAVAGYALGQTQAAEDMARAREALNKARYEQAAQMLHELYEQHQESVEATNALYWEAFARYRMQRSAERQRAVELLKLQLERHGDAETARDAESLLARLYAEMAERGEIEGITEIERLSEEERIREETRMQALHALMRMDPDKALPILEKIVRGEQQGSREMRRNALFILCQMGDVRAEDLLVELMHGDTEPDMLSEIVMCLAMIGSDRALDEIIALFEANDEPRVTEAAMYAIGQNGGDRAYDVLARIARNPDKPAELRAQALLGLAHSGRHEQVAELAAEILREGEDREIMEAALFALSQLEGEIPGQILRDLMANPAADDDMRAQALFFMNQRAEIPLGELVTTFEGTDNRDLKLQVCHVISQRDDEESLDALIGIARREKDAEIRQNLMFWIGEYDSEKAAAFLLEVIEGG